MPACEDCARWYAGQKLLLLVNFVHETWLFYFQVKTISNDDDNNKSNNNNNNNNNINNNDNYNKWIMDVLIMWWKYNSLRGFNKPLLKEHGSYHE